MSPAPKSDAFTALEGFNLGICALSGAGRGLDTPPDAVARYNSLMTQQRDELRRLIGEADKAPDAKAHRYYIEGMRHMLHRADEAARA